MFKKKFAATIALFVMVSFTVGAVAFPVEVGRVDRISSSTTFIGRAPAAIDKVEWVLDPATSTVQGVILTVRNTDPNAAHKFQIVVQVSCLSSGAQVSIAGVITFFPRTPFICAGSLRPVLTDSLAVAASATIPVPFDVAVAPERTQIENLSFIVVETE